MKERSQVVGDRNILGVATNFPAEFNSVLIQNTSLREFIFY